ncbi:MAG: hypothetical protein AB4062_11950 [Crocosphaera sp.]
MTFSSLVALGFGLTFMPEANAFTFNPTCQTKAVSSNTPATVVDTSPGTLRAEIRCRIRNGRICCIDTWTGRWACRRYYY